MFQGPLAANCPGCGRPELHKSCPAYGTPYYLSGVPLPDGYEHHQDNPQS